MTRLTKQQGESLCRIGAIQIGRRDRFVKAVKRCVAYYQYSCERKSDFAIGDELAHIEKRVWSALRLLDRRTWRPGRFRMTLDDISARLRNLSSAAREYLDFHHLKIEHDLPSAWPDLIDHGVVVDPVCLTNRDDQVLALQDLLGALATPVGRKKGPGRPRNDLGRVLYHFLAAAFSRDTGRAASDSSTRFMAVCLEIRRIYQLADWNPESVARSARRPRTRDR
jgi:hypothetical protein